MMDLKVKRLTNTTKLPTKAYEFDAGFDLYANEDAIVREQERTVIKTGIALEIPEGYVGLIWPRSGLAVKKGIDVLAGVIDASYRGEIMVCLYNSSVSPISETLNNVHISSGDKIAQILIQEIPQFKVVESSDLTSTTRGDKGFGSSG